MADESVRVRRGLVIGTLYRQYPGALAEELLSTATRVFYLAPDDTQARRDLSMDLSYLAGKGLVVAETFRAMGRKVFTWKLTSQGVDLAEGTLQDLAIAVESA